MSWNYTVQGGGPWGARGGVQGLAEGGGREARELWLWDGKKVTKSYNKDV